MTRAPAVLTGAAVAAAIAFAVGSGRPVAANSDTPHTVAVSGPVGAVPVTGPWTLRSDREFTGTKRGWPAGSFSGSQVTVPFSPNATRITGPAGVKSFEGSVGWYRTTVTAPADGPYAIRFESVNHKATVWLDGKRLGTHVGTYLPFELPVQLDAGTHTLVVRADWRDPARMKREAWHRTWFNYGGINREVSLRPLGNSDIVAPSVRTRMGRYGAVLVDVAVHLRNRAAARTITAQGALVRRGRRYEFRFPAQAFAARQTGVLRTTVEVPGAELWSPEAPNLYDLELKVPGESGYLVRTGLRTLRKRGTALLLNGEPIQLRGASIHEDAEGRGDALRPEDMDAVVSELKRIGANATRAQHPLSPALMERLDAAGILLWMGVGPVDAPGAWTSQTPALRRQSEGRVRTSLLQLQTHPSLIAWNLGNEVAGNGHRGGQASYMDTMARELKRRDPGRLVALDVWGKHPPGQPGGAMYEHIDAIGDTNYIGWYEDTFASPAAVTRAIRAHEAAMRRVFPGKLLVVTEFGAEGNTRNAASEPGGLGFQSDVIARHIAVYRSQPQLSGMLVWNLRDFGVSPAFAGGSIRNKVPGIRLVPGLNQKGLFTYGGRAKPSADVVRDALTQAGRRFAARSR